MEKIENITSSIDNIRSQIKALINMQYGNTIYRNPIELTPQQTKLLIELRHYLKQWQLEFQVK